MSDAKKILAIHALRAAVCAALDAGVFYQEDFNAACRGTWDLAHPAIENRLPDLVQVLGEDHFTWRARRQAASQEVAAGPRGTWIMVRKHWDTNRVSYAAVIADGTGDTHERSDGWDQAPTYDGILNRMISMEVYRARKDVEQERSWQAAAERVRALGLQQGMTLRNVEVSYQKYSTAVIEEINQDIGAVTLIGTKRGSSNRYRIVTSALSLEIADRSSTATPLAATETEPSLSLFAA